MPPGGAHVSVLSSKRNYGSVTFRMLAEDIAVFHDSDLPYTLLDVGWLKRSGFEDNLVDGKVHLGAAQNEGQRVSEARAGLGLGAERSETTRNA